MEARSRILIRAICLLLFLQNSLAKKRKSNRPKRPAIHGLHVRSDISYRFARTEVNCRMVNPLSTSRDAIFKFNIPKSAFLTNFSIESDNKLHQGVIKAKELTDEAEKEGQQKNTKSKKYHSRHTNTVQLPIKFNPRAEVKVKLMYQELIKKRLDKYEHVIHIDPEGVIPDLKVEVYIQEIEPITFLKVPPIIYDYDTFYPEDAKQQHAKTKRTSKNTANVRFNPSKRQQGRLRKKGLTGQFRVLYGLKHTLPPGNIQNENEFFAHFFSTQTSEPFAKDIVFILDTSGSMYGKKLTQLKDAMHNIIDSLNNGDQFNIITFDSWIRKWKPESLAPVTKYNVKKAKEFIQKLKARRMTDINGALSEGISFLSKQSEIGVATNNVSIIMFLTDGHPTEGETDTNKIIKTTRESNQGRYQLYTISFGDAVDFRFLQQLALQNGGTADKVYEDSDASLQLQNLYNDVASPLLSDVHMSYIGHGVKARNTTNRIFKTYFGGTELIVSGKLEKHSISIVVHPCVRAKTFNDSVSWCTPSLDEWEAATQFIPDNAGLILERLWAYMTLTQLSTAFLTQEDQTAQVETKNKIIQLSLKYGFLTEWVTMNLPGYKEGEQSLGLKDTDKLNSKPERRLRGRGWQDKIRDKSKRRRRWKRPRNYRLKGGSKKSKTPKRNSDNCAVRKSQTLTKIPVAAAKTLDGAILCLHWSSDAQPAWYNILKDRGLLVRALVQQHNGKTYLAAVDIMAPNLWVYTSQYAIRVNRKTARWGQSLRDAGVTVTEGKVMMEPFDGLSVDIHMVAGKLMLVIGETASLTGRQTGVLAKVKTWTIQDSNVVLPKSPPVSVPITGPYTIGVGQVTCLLPNQDIFKLLGERPNLYRL